MNGFDEADIFDGSGPTYTPEWPDEYKRIIEFCDWMEDEMTEDEFWLMHECLLNTLKEYLCGKEYDALEEYKFIDDNAEEIAMLFTNKWQHGDT